MLKKNRTMKMGFCFLIVPLHLGEVIQQNSAAIKECFVSIMEKAKEFLPLFLLIAVHLHSNQTQVVVSILRENLFLPSDWHLGAVNQATVFLTKELLTEESLCRKVLSLEAVDQSIESSVEQLFGCVDHLLDTLSFNFYNMDVSQWVFTRIERAKAPIHPLFCKLLQSFVKGIFSPLLSANPKTRTSLAKIDEEQILSVFFHNLPANGLSSRSNFVPRTDNYCAQLCCLYYFSVYNLEYQRVLFLEAESRRRPRSHFNREIDHSIYGSSFFFSFFFFLLFYHHLM